MTSVNGVFICASRERRLKLCTDFAQLINVTDQILEEETAGDQTSVEKQECADLKQAYLVLMSELSFLITHDCDQVFLLFNDGIFICDYYKGLPELCLDIKNTHKLQT